jgi:ABC-type multidrug transport system permease subunit
VLLFIAANLTLGLTFSSIARNQLQAMQMTFFFFLPSILLSGFMFPFRGMPRWAQAIGEALPLTHFLRIVRGVLLKGNGVADVLSETWPLVTFMIVVLLIGLRDIQEHARLIRVALAVKFIAPPARPGASGEVTLPATSKRTFGQETT